MNEISLLMNLLSKKGYNGQFGAPKEEILEVLGAKDKNSSIYFQKLLVQLSNYLQPIGMQIRYNPLNSYWYIRFESEISELISANPFEGKPSLAATLFCTLIYCLKSSGNAYISEIQKARNKKYIKDDLKELEVLGYIEIRKETEQVKLTPLIGYQLDIARLLLNTALKVKD
ncbi:MAG: hypothetical protein EAX89_02580 [Candidatus Lokiarchaeota archaeon]|nr:hypothetical protein [Candidatus Lokiarchaeota archaeon]